LPDAGAMVKVVASARARAAKKLDPLGCKALRYMVYKKPSAQDFPMRLRAPQPNSRRPMGRPIMRAVNPLLAKGGWQFIEDLSAEEGTLHAEIANATLEAARDTRNHYQRAP
jgi:hypothetical protein